MSKKSSHDHKRRRAVHVLFSDRIPNEVKEQKMMTTALLFLAITANAERYLPPPGTEIPLGHKYGLRRECAKPDKTFRGLSIYWCYHRTDSGAALCRYEGALRDSVGMWWVAASLMTNKCRAPFVPSRIVMYMLDGSLGEETEL